MRVRDRYLFALHTIKENKSRSILTVVISMFLSLLIMGLMCIAISFSNNSSKVLNSVYFADGAIIQSNYSNMYEYKANQEIFNKKYYDTFISNLDEHQEIVSYVTYNTNSDLPFIFTDAHYPLSIGFEIIEGRNIIDSKECNEVIVSQKMYAQSLEFGDPYEVGSTHTYVSSYTRVTPTGVRINRPISVDFKVVGIFAPNNEKYVINGGKNVVVDSYASFIGDIRLALYADENVYAFNASINYLNSSSKINPDKVLSSINSLNEDLNKNMPTAIEVTILGFGRDADFIIDEVAPTTCEAYKQVQELNKFKVIFIGGGAGIAVVLLLISVGSLANSIMISIDRSKKFIGLLKALGIRAKALKNIIVFESMTLISVGVLIAYIILFIIQYPLNLINTALVSSLYGSYMEVSGYTPTFNIPIYVFFGAIVLFVSLTILFARGSLRTISKMDPIEVISEVS